MAQGDPDLWYMTVVTMNHDLPQVPALLTWIVTQPDCDAATAAPILRAPLDRLLLARVPLPVSLLSRPFTGRAPRTRWTITDECILRAA